MSSRDEGDRYIRKYRALFLLSGTIANTIIIILHLADSTSVYTQQILAPSIYSTNKAFKLRGKNRSCAFVFKAWKTCPFKFRRVRMYQYCYGEVGGESCSARMVLIILRTGKLRPKNNEQCNVWCREAKNGLAKMEEILPRYRFSKTRRPRQLYLWAKTAGHPLSSKQSVYFDSHTRTSFRTLNSPDDHPLSWSRHNVWRVFISTPPWNMSLQWETLFHYLYHHVPYRCLVLVITGLWSQGKNHEEDPKWTSVICSFHFVPWHLQLGQGLIFDKWGTWSNKRRRL